MRSNITQLVMNSNNNNNNNNFINRAISNTIANIRGEISKFLMNIFRTKNLTWNLGNNGIFCTNRYGSIFTIKNIQPLDSSFYENCIKWITIFEAYDIGNVDYSVDGATQMDHVIIIFTKCNKITITFNADDLKSKHKILDIDDFNSHNGDRIIFEISKSHLVTKDDNTLANTEIKFRHIVLSNEQIVTKNLDRFLDLIALTKKYDGTYIRQNIVSICKNITGKTYDVSECQIMMGYGYTILITKKIITHGLDVKTYWDIDEFIRKIGHHNLGNILNYVDQAYDVGYRHEPPNIEQ